MRGRMLKASISAASPAATCGLGASAVALPKAGLAAAATITAASTKIDFMAFSLVAWTAIRAGLYGRRGPSPIRYSLPFVLSGRRDVWTLHLQAQLEAD